MIIKKREKDAILQSLRAGVVPKLGLQHIQVGRKHEISAVLEDLERVKDGSAFVKFVIGRFGSGKSFFLNLSQAVALEKKFVVAQADITPDHRLHGKDGQARALYGELMQNLSTKGKSSGGALESIIERWISDVDYSIRQNGGTDDDIKKAIFEKLKPLQDIVNGYDFISVVVKYLEAYLTNNDMLKSSAIRWLKAGYRLKSEANSELGVRNIIEDENIYEYLKLFAKFATMAGYSGLLINIDEMVVLSERLNNSVARNINYEMILRIVNDCFQGNVTSIGFIFGGTDNFLEDKRRGLYSYEALATRLAENEFAINGINDFTGPIIRLENLSQEDFYVLLLNIRNVFAEGQEDKYLVSDEGLKEFMINCNNTLGAEYYTTPRDSIKRFVGFLSILERNPELNYRDVLNKQEFTNRVVEERIEEEDSNEEFNSDDLATFQL